jgi:hypothetical protein
MARLLRRIKFAQKGGNSILADPTFTTSDRGSLVLDYEYVKAKPGPEGDTARWWRDGAVVRWDRQMATPVRIPDPEPGRQAWVFRGQIYDTDMDLSAADVQAIVFEADNKKMAALARARAAAEMAESIASAPRSRRGPIPDDVKVLVWQRDGGKCVRCGSNRNLEFDHIIPVVMGGANTARNLQLLCEGCNRAKSGSLV